MPRPGATSINVHERPNVLSEHLPWHRARVKSWFSFLIARFTLRLLRLTTANLHKPTLALRGSVEPALNSTGASSVFFPVTSLALKHWGWLIVSSSASALRGFYRQHGMVFLKDTSERAHRDYPEIYSPIAWTALQAGGGPIAGDQTQVLERFLAWSSRPKSRLWSDRCVGLSRQWLALPACVLTRTFKVRETSRLDDTRLVYGSNRSAVESR